MPRASVERAFVGLAAVLSADEDAAACLRTHESVLKKRYAAFVFWPADAQLALHIMAWVIGPGFSNQPFRNAVNRAVPDFAGAAGCCAMPDRGHPAVVTLNEVNRCLLLTAHRVLERELDFDSIYSQVLTKPLWL